MGSEINLKEHLPLRHCDLSLHRPIIDEAEGVATFYLYTLTGKFAGFQQYRPLANKEKHNHPKEGRYFTYRTEGVVSCFGVESLHLDDSVVFLTEGVFDSTRLTSKGVPALAVLSNNVKPEFHNFLRFTNRKVIAVCDNNEAGKKLAKFGHYVETTDELDLGDSSDEYVEYLIKKYK